MKSDTCSQRGMKFLSLGEIRSYSEKISQSLYVLNTKEELNEREVYKPKRSERRNSQDALFSARDDKLLWTKWDLLLVYRNNVFLPGNQI